MTTTARDVMADLIESYVWFDAGEDGANELADAILAALTANPDALLAWVREAVPGVVCFVDGPEVRERVRAAICLCQNGSGFHGCDLKVPNVIAAVTTGGAT